jgi:hypothetical protein
LKKNIKIANEVVATVGIESPFSSMKHPVTSAQHLQLVPPASGIQYPGSDYLMHPYPHIS